MLHGPLITNTGEGARPVSYIADDVGGTGCGRIDGRMDSGSNSKIGNGQGARGARGW